jgi:hypothetical protein
VKFRTEFFINFSFLQALNENFIEHLQDLLSLTGYSNSIRLNFFLKFAINIEYLLVDSHLQLSFIQIDLLEYLNIALNALMYNIIAFSFERKHLLEVIPTPVFFNLILFFPH